MPIVGFWHPITASHAVIGTRLSTLAEAAETANCPADDSDARMAAPETMSALPPGRPVRAGHRTHDPEVAYRSETTKARHRARVMKTWPPNTRAATTRASLLIATLIARSEKS